MALTTRDSFDEFHRRIQLTASQRVEIETKRQSTHNYLLRGFGVGSDMPILRTVLIGSAARGTIIRPMNDIDVMAVFSDEYNVYENTYQYDSRKFIYRIRQVLDQDCTVVIGTRGQAVRLFYKNGAHVDIAPVFRDKGGYYLLPRGDGGWLRTDPGKQQVWLEAQHVALSSQLKPVVRILKRWNNEHGKHFNSYHLEIVVANVFSSMGANWRENLKDFFGWAPAHLDSHDPAGHSGNLAGHMSYVQRQALLQRLNNAHTRAEWALKEEAQGNHEEAMRLWSVELGNEFPAYGRITLS